MKKFTCILLLSFQTFICKADTDSLKLFFNAFGSALNTETEKVYSVKSVFIPMLNKAPFITTGLLKIYPSNNPDSLHNFYTLFNDTLGYYYYNKSIYFFNQKEKSVGELYLDETKVNYVKSRKDIFFLPLVANYNALRSSPMENQTIIIHKDSLYYRGTDSLEDKSYYIKTIILKDDPFITIDYKEELFDSTSQLIQLKSYDINELSNISQTIFPKSLSNNIEQMFPGYLNKLYDLRSSHQVRNVKEGSIYIEWKGLLQNGDTIYSTQIKSRYIVLDFWYINCYWCWKAIDELKKFYSDADTSLVQVFGINPYDLSQKDKAFKTFIDKGGNYPIVYDYDKRIIKEYEVYGFPNIFLIDTKTNKIILYEAAYKEGLAERLEKLIYKSKIKSE